nr:hypothetical protein [Tanacetum cinerariifolium]
MPSLFADTHNMVAILEKSDAAEGFEQIIDFLSGSYIHYALTMNLHIYISCIKQFWNSVSIKRSGDVTRLQALVDKKKIVIFEAVIREILQLNNAEGLPMKVLDSYYSSIFERQKDFWNEFSTAMASALICLSKGQRFNFSKYIFDSLVRNVDSSSKFYMYHHFIKVIIQAQVGDLSSHTTLFISPALTQKVFANMRRVGKGFSGVETPLFEGMIADRQPAEEEFGAEQVDAVVAAAVVEDVVETIAENVSHDAGRMFDDMNEGIKLVKDAEVAESEGRHVVAKQVEKQAEIYNIDLDRSSKVLSIQEDDSEVQEVVDVVTTAKLITEVTAAASQVSAVSTTIPAELPLNTPAETLKVKDKGKGIMIEAPKPMKKKDQIKLDAEYYIKIYHGMKKRPQTESEARKNMMIYLKNTAGYKMDFFKGMSYADICLIFQARFDENIRFLFKSREEMEAEDEEIIKSINETPVQKAAKRRKLNEEAQEAEALKKQLEIVHDEDEYVFTEATPIGRKVPVVDYEIVMINNKPRYKIIRADDTHQ